MVDVACRLLLVVFVVGVIVYRRECLDGTCRRKSPWLSDFFRLATGAVATIGFFVPVVGVILAVILAISMLDVRYEKTAKSKHPVAVSQRVNANRSAGGRTTGADARPADRTS